MPSIRHSLQDTLRCVVESLSEKNYDKSSAQYRFLLDVGITHGRIDRNDVYNEIGRIAQPAFFEDSLNNPTTQLLIRFIGDIEADQKTSRHALRLHERCSTSALDDFFGQNLDIMGDFDSISWGTWADFLTKANLIAQWANLGYVEEKTIRNRILQSLINHPKLLPHQADALIILFRLAGATFEAYVDPSMVDRCFGLLTSFYSGPSIGFDQIQEVVALRKRSWEGLPPPPVFTIGKPKPIEVNQSDPAGTPVATAPGSLTTRSLSINIATQSGLTIADTSDDACLLDPIGIAPYNPYYHNTFYLKDGNVEVLCDNTLFRVHTSILSTRSPALRQMFAQTSLATAGSLNGCPRILSSDTDTDFAILLKMMYHSGFPEQNKTPDFTTFSSLLRITAKYEMPTVRSQILETVRDAYPGTLKGIDPSKTLGESVFGKPTHPNAVLDLFVQQNLTPMLPLAYYMAVRRGLDSLMDARLPASVRLPLDTLQVAVRGLIALREMELKEIHRLVLGPKGSYPCSSLNCPSHKQVDPTVSEAHQKVVDQITNSSGSGTKILRVLSISDVCGGGCYGFCQSCVERWEKGHAKLRKKAWAALPDVFGVKL